MDIEKIDMLLCKPNIYDEPEKVIELTKKKRSFRGKNQFPL